MNQFVASMDVSHTKNPHHTLINSWDIGLPRILIILNTRPTILPDVGFPMES